MWLLTQPQQPVLIGELNLVRSNQGVSLRYATVWLQSGFPLSEDLPLIDQEFLPADKGTAVGAVDDARPDRWGEHVIRFIDKPPRLSLLEYLYFAGDDRFGALGVSTCADEYLPRKLGPLPTLADADQHPGARPQGAGQRAGSAGAEAADLSRRDASAARGPRR